MFEGGVKDHNSQLCIQFIMKVFVVNTFCMMCNYGSNHLHRMVNISNLENVMPIHTRE